MKIWTIRYQLGTYSGTEQVRTDDDAEQDQAIAKMWRRVERDGGIGMAYRSARVIDVEDDNED